MMAVQDIGLKQPYCLPDGCFKGLCIEGELPLRQFREDAAAIRHDIAHAGYREVEVPAVKPDISAVAVVYDGCIQPEIPLDPGDKKVLVPSPGRASHEGLQIFAAAGEIRDLADDMENSHSLHGISATLSSFIFCSKTPLSSQHQLQTRGNTASTR